MVFTGLSVQKLCDFLELQKYPMQPYADGTDAKSSAGFSDVSATFSYLCERIAFNSQMRPNCGSVCRGGMFGVGTKGPRSCGDRLRGCAFHTCSGESSSGKRSTEMRTDVID